MTPEEVNKLFLDHESRISRHSEDIKTLFEQQKTIKEIAKSTQDMATHLTALTEQVRAMNQRVSSFEDEKAKKGFAIWQIVVSAALGAVVTFIISRILV